MGKTESAEKAANSTAKAVGSTWDEKEGMGGFLTTVVLTTLTVPLAATVGAASGVNPEEVRAGQEHLQKVYQENPIEKRLCGAICKRGVKETGLTWLSPLDAPETLTNKDPSLLMEIEFLTYALQPEGWERRDRPLINANLRLFVTVRCSLLRPTDKEEVYTGIWRYVSRKHQFVAWTKKDAALLNQALDKCSEELAKEIIEDVFHR
jgi:hypothetical protein